MGSNAFSRFHPRLQHAIVSRLGWTQLRPVQEEASHALLDGKNAVVLAPTAGGKTEAAMFPTLSQLLTTPYDCVGAIYIAPIKALLNNQAERLGQYTEMVGLRRFVWHGDTGQTERTHFLAEPAELLMTTPESLEVMLVSQRVNPAKLFANLRMVIIDEVHAIAGSDRGAHLLSVLERIRKLSRHDVQRVGLSATVGNPEAILQWIGGTSQRPGVVIDPPQAPRPRELLVLYREDLGEVAREASRLAAGQKSLLFCQSRSTTEAVAGTMQRAGTTVFVHHSAVSREDRALAEETFHRGGAACIVCTSTLELGIDVGDLDRVLQIEAPDSVGSFLQRMGRTGRRKGQVANTTFLCSTREGVLRAVALVELAKRGWVEPVHLDPRSWPVLIHQLLAMALAHEGVRPSVAWEHMRNVPDFQGITEEEFERLVEWMIKDGALVLTSGLLVLGPKAERLFGRRNFMELFAVFSSPQTYTVQTAHGQALGTLQQDFVDQLVNGVSSFLLGGRAWAVLQVRHDDRRVVVEKAPRGKQPTWGGYLPQFLGSDLCQEIQRILQSDQVFPYLDPAAADVLSGWRAELEDAFAGGGVEELGDELTWWTFAGGRINSTLRYALQEVDSWEVVSDNFRIFLRAKDIQRARLGEALERLREPHFWKDTRWGEIAAMLPNYRLSKFQPLMPPCVEREVVGNHLLDVPGARHWVDA